MAVIQNLDIVLGAKTEKLDKGLSASTKDVAKFKSDLMQKLPGSNFVSGISGTLAKVGPVGLAAAGAVAAIGTAAAATAITVAKVREQMGAIDVIAKQASSLGTTFRDISAFTFAAGEAGVTEEGAVKSLQKMQLNLTEAASKGGALEDRLNALGTNSAALLEAGPIEATKQISSIIAGMKNPADQLSLSFKLYGREGVNLVNLLKGGPEAIEDSVTVADRLGLTLADAQSKQVEAANDAWGRVELIATGVFRQIAAEVSPVITVIAQSISGTADGFAGWQTVLPSIVDNLTYGAGVIYDIVELSQLATTILQKLVRLDFSGIGESIQSAFDFSTGDKFVAKVQAARDAAAAAAQGNNLATIDVAALEAAAEAEQTAADAAKKAGEAREAAAQKSKDAIASRLTSMQEEIATLRTSKEAVDRLRLAREGATSAQLSSFDALTQEKSQLEQVAEAMKRGAALREQFATPAEKLDKELTDLQQLLNVGAIDFGTFATAAREAAGRIGKEGDKSKSAPPPSFAALQKGSVEAFSAGLRNERAGDPTKLQAEGNKLLGLINTNLERMAAARGMTVGNAG